MMSALARRVEVLRKSEWVTCRLAEVRAGERFRMFEPDGKRLGEYVAAKDGRTNSKGFGEISVETPVHED